ncbi:MAG: hypothetical protein ACYS47_07520 [Planctomycetota bacterium]|jgi:hypothetical protein
MKRTYAVWIVLGLLAAACGSCTGPHVGRAEYVQAWVLATLRAREKGTEPREELVKIISARGYSKEAFEEAQVRWFEKEVNEEILLKIREILDTPGLPSRVEYVRARVLIYLRSRIRGTPFAEELRTFGRGRSEAAFAAAERIWVGDQETDLEIDALADLLAGALNVSWETWSEITNHPRWGDEQSEDWLEEELQRRDVTQADWSAAEGVHSAWEIQEGESGSHQAGNGE